MTYRACELGTLCIDRRWSRWDLMRSRLEFRGPLKRLPTGGVFRSFQASGVVAEWLNAAVLKTAERETVP